MLIVHNLVATNISNKLKKTDNNKSKSMEKLSSGLRINRASDDAAGLCISQKMKAQIRGLDQAGRNIQDGISLIQTAEGGLSEIENPNLQRMRELAVQASNGTLTDEDRSKIQQEVEQLKRGINYIANNTEFNTLSLLNGKYDEAGSIAPSDSIVDYVQYITTSGGVNDKYNYSGTDYASAIVDFSNITSASDVANLVDKGFNYTCCTCDKAYSIKFVNGAPDTTRLNDSDPVMEVDVSSITNGTDLVNKIIETAYGQAGFVYDPTSSSSIPTVGTEIPATATSFVTHYSQLSVAGAKLYVYDDRAEYALNSWPDSSGSGAFNLNVYGEIQEKEDKFLYLDIQAGSNAGDAVRIKIPNATVEQLGIDDLSVDPQKNAMLAITKIDNAISRVSESRSTVGAYQNTFEHTLNNVLNYAENLTASDSRIEDLDMAKEMMEMSKNSVLEQAAQSLLAQANQAPNKVLDLLK